MVELIAAEADTTIARLLDRIQSGDEVVITRGGEPVARLVSNSHPLQQSSPAAKAMERIRERASQFAGQPFDWEALKRDRDAGRP